MISFETGDRSILSYGGITVSGRSDASSLISGAGGHDNVLLNELCRTHCITRRMAEDEFSGMEQSTRLINNDKFAV